ncbi:MAG: right-handed parallel beta-helix repeat-containing protein, partial [Candidatus Bilamarchaeaceae archaeon]
MISNFYVYSSIGTIITNNTGRTSNIGYLLYLNANNNYLYDNVAFLNNYGFYVYGSSENILENNTAYDNDYAGFMLNASANNNISNSIAYNTTNGSGFFLFESVGGVLRNISAFNNSNYGILLFDVNDTSLLYVNFSLNNWSGVYAQNSINLTLNNTITTLNNQSGLFIYSSENITLLNLASHVNKINGITLQSSENINITNAHLYNNSRDLYLGNGVAVPSRNVYLANITIDNPIGNLENYTVVDIVDSLETGTIYYINWSANPTGYPSSRISFNNKFIIIENLTSGVSIDSISWRWTDSELGVHDESLFELWKYNASGWTMLNNTPDIPNNVLSLTNMNPSSIYGILEVINCPLIDSPGTYIQGDNYRGAKNNAEPLIGFACVKITSSNVVYDCNGYNITDNGTTSFTNSYGILLNGSLKNVTLRNCNGVSNYSYGFYVYDSNDTIIFNSTSFNNVGPGFYIYGGFNNTLINNTAYNNSRGFEISMSLNVTLVSNEAFNNTDEGFNLISGTFFSILKDSRGAFNKRGFVLDFSYNATLINNTAYGNLEEGFYIYGGNNNTFENNTAYRNVQYGFVIYTSNNTFIRNLHLYNNSLDFGVIINTFIHGYLLNVSNLTIDNPHGNFENYTSVDIIDVLGDPLQSELYTINWSQNSTSLPNKRFSFAQKFINISSPLFANIDLISFRWLDSELGVHDESLFELWKYNASGWTMLNNTPDISNNVLSLTNMNPSSIYGILENNGSKCMLINESGKYNISNNIKGAPYTISLSDVGMEVAVCIEINASDVEFDCQGYSITNNGTNAADGSAGILIDANRQNVTVKNCVVSNYSHGIATYEASNNYIYNNTAYNNTDFGIILFYFSNDNVISNNSLYENSKGSGAYIYSASNNFTYNNVYNNSQVGILLLQYSDTGYIHNNIIENHTNSNAMGVYIDSSLNCLISDNIFRNNYNHIYASTTTVTRILNNNMSLSQNNGVYITDSSFVNTSNNLIYGAANGMGILYNNTHYGYIASNIINESFTGIFLNYSNSNLLIDNIVYNNSKNGIEIFESNQNNLLNNTAYLNAEQGFIVSSSDYINISEGESYNNSYSGYFLIATTQSVIRNVTSYNNTQHGVMLDSSGNNNITNNILVDNLYSGVYIIGSSDDNFITFNKIENPNAQYGGIYSLTSVRIYIYNNTINNSRIGVNLVNSNTMFIADNNITNNSIMGIYFDPNTMSVEISNNYVCFNDRMDINNSASYSYTNTGQLDRCDYWYN